MEQYPSRKTYRKNSFRVNESTQGQAVDDRLPIYFFKTKYVQNLYNYACSFSVLI